MENNCSSINNNVVFGLDITIHILILFSIISMFFVFYVSKVETTQLNGHIVDNINSGLNTLLLSQDQESLKELKMIGQTPTMKKIIESYNQPDNLSKINNEWLFKTIFMTNGFLLCFTLGITVLLLKQCNSCINIKDILLTNFLTFILIGGVEYMFFTHVGMKYVPSKPSEIVDTFFSTSKKLLNQ